MSTQADKVRAAAGHIEKYGLHKGDLWEDLGDVDLQYAPYDEKFAAGVKCCTVGALLAVGEEADLREGLARHLGLLEKNPAFGREAWEPEFFDTIPQWNDAEERTTEEVVAALRAFADALEAA